MPKITAKPDLTEKQFASALRRAGFIETRPMLGMRRFRSQPVKGLYVTTSGIYQGRFFFARFDARLTLKHLQNELARINELAGTIKEAPEPTPLERAAQSAPLTPGMPATI